MGLLELAELSDASDDVETREKLSLLYPFGKSVGNADVSGSAADS